MREDRPGDFHRGATPFLHFHYPVDGRLLADLRLGRGGFRRLDVSDEAGQQELLARVVELLDDETAR